MNLARRLSLVSLALLLFGSHTVLAAPKCYTSYGGTKPNKLYLYFPTADDASYPEFGITGSTPPTSPARAFDIANIPNYTGNVNDLRNAVYDAVADDYCEFNVEVIQTTTAPPTTFARRNTVSIGTDDGTASGGLFGLAQNVDTGDTTAVDFAHEWAATYQGFCGAAGGALEGANSTLDRWAAAIAGTAAHEAGHNYGLSHTDGVAVGAGEDPLVHHLMAAGTNYSCEDRAGYRRHFSDHEYSVLAANVGLSVQTVWNWDFVNPNAQTAARLRMTILSTQSSLTTTGPYNGSESPWINPTVSASMGTQVFQGTTWNRFQVTWSAGHAWDGHVPGGPGPSPGVSGQVAGGASFHIGTGFSGVNYNLPNPIIITDVTLLDGSNNALALHPRAVSFDSGTLDAGGTFFLDAFNLNGAPMQLRDILVMQLPRLLSIDSMVTGQQPIVDVRGIPFYPWGEPKRIPIDRTLKEGEKVSIPIAKTSDGRHIVETVDCKAEDRVKGRDVVNCTPGINVDLFPATTVYVTGTVVDPDAKYYDYRSQQYVNGPLTTHVFLQFVGRHPDLDKNSRDDSVDILTKRVKDENRDGVPDAAQRKRRMDRNKG